MAASVTRQSVAGVGAGVSSDEFDLFFLALQLLNNPRIVIDMRKIRNRFRGFISIPVMFDDADHIIGRFWKNRVPQVCWQRLKVRRG
jgi:hypothetical protein